MKKILIFIFCLITTCSFGQLHNILKPYTSLQAFTNAKVNEGNAAVIDTVDVSGMFVSHDSTGFPIDNINVFPTAAATVVWVRLFTTEVSGDTTIINNLITKKSIRIPRSDTTHALQKKGSLIYDTLLDHYYGYIQDPQHWRCLDCEGWGLTGNSGIDSVTNFIGTTDGHPLIFKTNNTQRGFFNSGSGDLTLNNRINFSTTDGQILSLNNTTNGLFSHGGVFMGYQYAGSRISEFTYTGIAQSAGTGYQFSSGTVGVGLGDLQVIRVAAGILGISSDPTGGVNDFLGNMILNQLSAGSSIVAGAMFNVGTGVQASYSGLANTTSGSAVVTGTSTFFLNTLRVGDTVHINTYGDVAVQSISSNTNFTATANLGSTLPGVSYYNKTLQGQSLFAVYKNSSVMYAHPPEGVSGTDSELVWHAADSTIRKVAPVTGSSQDLQSVLDEGNTAVSQSVNIQDGSIGAYNAGVTNISALDGVNGNVLIKTGGANGTISATNLTNPDKTFELPDHNGTLAIGAISGTDTSYTDVNGFIPVTGGGGGSTLFPPGSTGTATGTVGAELDGNDFTITNSSNALFGILTADDGGFISNADGSNRLEASTDIGGARIVAGSSSIILHNSTGITNYTATTHNFTGNTVFADNGTPDVGKVPIGTDGAGNWTWEDPSGGGTTTNALTVNNSGSGDASAFTFNGSAAKTISYNSIGAVPSTRTINGLDLSANQTFATGTSGSDFGISSSGTTHTFNIPTASASNRGLLSTTDWSTFNNKQSAITTGTTAQYIRGDLSLATFPTNNTSFTNGAGYLINSNNLSDVSSASTARTNLGATTVGGNLFTLTNPSAISFIKIAADNSVSTRTASQFRGDIGSTTVGDNIFTLTNPSAITFLRINADNTVTARSAANFKADLSLDNVANVDQTNASNISSGTLGDARLSSNIINKTVANSYTAGMKQTFQADATNTGLNFGGVSSDPSSLSNGDVWRNTTSDRLKFYSNSTVFTISTTADKLSAFAATTSAELRGVLSDENGSGVALFDNASGPTFTNPVVGTQSSSDNSTKAASTAFVGTAVANQRPTSAHPGSNITTTSGSLGNATGYNVPMAANKTYRVSGVLNVTTDAAGVGMLFAFTIPSGATMTIGFNGTRASTATNATAVTSSGTSNGLAYGNIAGGGSGIIFISGYVTTSATTGDLQLQWRAQTATNTQTIVTGSAIDITEVQ